MTDRGKRAAIATVGVIVALYAAAVGYLMLNETALVYPGYARVDTRRAPNDTTLKWDSVRVMAADSTPVYLLVSEIDRARRPWVIYLHGNAASVFGRGNVARYKLLRDAGYNVAAVEYRGFGPSRASGAPSERGIYADANAAWDWLTETLGVPANWIVVYGYSLGSGPALMLASTRKPAALVTEGAFASLPAAAAERYPWVPTRLVMRNRFDNRARAKFVDVRWLIFHGRPDTDVSFEDATRLADAAAHDELIPLDVDHDVGVTGNSADAVRRIEPLVYLSRATLQYGPPHMWDMADRVTVRLPPDSFPELPTVVREDLNRRGCRVPQASLGGFARSNVVTGAFITRESKDWAVMCSIARRSRVLVYRDGATATIDTLGETADKDFLQGDGNGDPEFSHRISPIRPSMILSYWRAFGGEKPPPMDHLGIEFAFVGKASGVAYFYNGKWLSLTGAD